MSKDIAKILANWPEGESAVTARLITATDSRQMLQVRLDCGVLQMDLDGRPDGTRPHDCRTFMEYVRRCKLDNKQPVAPAHQSGQYVWDELDRELTQFYHRRLALLAVAQQFQQAVDHRQAKLFYRRAARDANHTLAAMNFITDNCDDDDQVSAHERFKPFVLWHRTLALTQLQLLEKNFDEAVEQVKLGVDDIAGIYESHGLGKYLRHDPSLAELRSLERNIRAKYGVKTTLKEQLQHAIFSENYELAAQLRDQLRAKGKFAPL